MSKHLIHGRSTKEFQDFFTPPNAAEQVAQFLLSSISDNSVVTTVLDPAVGSGNLIWPLLASDKKFQVYCIDIQLDYLTYVATEAKRRGYSVTKEPFGLCITNHTKE